MITSQSQIKTLLDQLEEKYPDSIRMIKDLPHDERIAYIAKRELIEHIKLMIESDKKPKKG